MVNSTRPLAIALGLATLAAVAPPAKAEDLKPVGVVTTLTGTATIKRATYPEPQLLKRLDDVYLADRLTTGHDSLARILLGGKALVTVRERSVLTITEVPGMATVEVGPGGVALAVVKERMKRGESIEIRTPNAVAAVRGTVVIAEVSQMTSQAGAAAGSFTTTFTVVRGLVEVRSLDPFTGHPVGPAVSLGAQRSLRITGAVAPGRPERLTPEAARRVHSDYKVSVAQAPPAATSELVKDHVRGAAKVAAAGSGTSETPGHPEGSDVAGLARRQGSVSAWATSVTASRGESGSPVAAVAPKPSPAGHVANPVTAADDFLKNHRSLNALPKK